jgi:hypothetical protein
MALKAFKKVDFKDKDISKFQSNVQEFLGQFNTVLNNGLILENLSVGTTTVDIPHLLGRSYQGWHLLDIDADARVWRDSTSSANSSKFLPLKASASATIKIWVF